MHCSSFRCDFLRLVVSTRDQRREDSPLRGRLNWGAIPPKHICSIERLEGVTQLLDLQAIASDWHFPLLNVVQLLTKLKFSCGRIGRYYLFEVSPRLIWRFGLSNVVEHVIMDAWCKAVQHQTPIALVDKVLVHLVLLRCVVVSVEFFQRKSASHLSIHFELLLLLLDANCASCCCNDQSILSKCELGHNTHESDGLGSSYEAL